MEISQKLLCFLFLASMAVGVVLGVIYDFLKFSRLVLGLSPSPADNLTNCKRWKHRCHAILLFVEDLLFILLCGGSLMLLLYFLNDGIFRFWAPLGLGCGFFVYSTTIGKVFESISKAVAFFIRRMIRWLIRLMAIPVRCFFKGVMMLVISPMLRAIHDLMCRNQIKKTERSVKHLVSAADAVFETILPLEEKF